MLGWHHPILARHWKQLTNRKKKAADKMLADHRYDEKFILTSAGQILGGQDCEGGPLVLILENPHKPAHINTHTHTNTHTGNPDA